MRCPYHSASVVHLAVPVPHNPEAHLPESARAWVGWLDACCNLPVWRCPHGALHPIDARYCTWHGCERPPPDRVTHEVSAGPTGRGDIPAPTLVARRLERPPAADGRSTPGFAGNVLVYLDDAGDLLALDLGTGARMRLAGGIRAAAVRVRGGEALAALAIPGGVRYLAWDVRDVREALRDGTEVESRETAPTRVHLLGLPGERSRLHQGSGPLRLVVEHDPLPEEAVELYQGVTGAPPGEWLIRRTGNPKGPPVPHLELRPQRLDQVPVPIQGGVLVIGRLRWFGENVEGALLVPTVPGFVAGA